MFGYKRIFISSLSRFLSQKYNRTDLFFIIRSHTHAYNAFANSFPKNVANSFSDATQPIQIDGATFYWKSGKSVGNVVVNGNVVRFFEIFNLQTIKINLLVKRNVIILIEFVEHFSFIKGNGSRYIWSCWLWQIHFFTRNSWRNRNYRRNSYQVF